MGEYRKVAHPANMHDGDILWFNHIYESDRKKTHTACLFIFLGIGEIKVFHGGNQFYVLGKTLKYFLFPYAPFPI